jgi:membrane protease YdiL (CAAX protease family)
MLIPLTIFARQSGNEIEIWQQALLSLLAAYFLQLLRCQPFSEMVGKLDFVWLKQLLIGGVIGSILMLLPALLLYVSGWVHWELNNIAVDVILIGLMGCVAVTIAEEVVFRGVFFQRLNAGVGVIASQILVAAYCLLTHSGNPGMERSVKWFASINIFFASILFGLVYLRTRSLAMPIGLHMMANFTQGNILGFGVSGHSESGLLHPIFDNSPVWLTGGQFGLEASAPGLVFLIFTIAFVYRWKNLKTSGLAS